MIRLVPDTLQHRDSRFVLILAALIGLLFGACGNPAAGTEPGFVQDSGHHPGRDSASQLPSAEAFDSSDSSFTGYLEYFSELHPLDQWPEQGQDVLVHNWKFWLADKSDRDFTLKYFYHRLAPVMYRFIPTREVNKLAPAKARIANPLSRYTFFAFAKEKRGRYWLCSMLGLKREMEQEVYHQHPFLLATYREDGGLIDELIWWCIVDDDIQVYDEVDVAGDTLLVGRKEHASDSELSEVYARVVIDRDGRFREVYSAWPEGYLRE